MRLPSIRADLRSIHVNAPPFSQIELISGHLLLGGLPKFLPEQFLFIMDTPDSILVSVAADMVGFR